MRTITTVIFDFDSTLAYSLPEIKKIFLEIAQEFSYPATPKLIEELIHKEAQEIIRELKVPLWELPKVEKLFRLKMKAIIKNVELFPQTKKMITDLKKEGLRLGIFTSNAKENIEWFLQKHHLEKDFDFIDGGSGFFGKAQKLKKLLRRKKLRKEDVVYIGDETRDIVAAQKNQVKVVGVTWGMNPRPVMAKYHPDYLVDNQQELVAIIKTLLK
jgi:HAD superfamily hydrolase (TIGR01549 family)